MRVTLVDKNNDEQIIKNVWEIQSNTLNHRRELQLVGYDHIVKYRDDVRNVKSISVEFEIENIK